MMKTKTSNLILDFLYLFCLYLAVKLLPFGDWFPVEWGKDVAVGVCCLVLILLAVYEGLRIKKVSCLKEFSPWFSLPFLLVCCSNFIYAFFSLTPTVSYTPSLFYGSLFSLVTAAVLEEILFRYFLLEFFYDLLGTWKYRNMMTILFTALAFGLMHVVNFFGNPVGAVFQQIGYTFFLGLVFGFMALYLNEIWLPSLLHILYNFLNLQLFQTFYALTEMNLIYLLFSMGIGLVFVLYLVLLVLLKHKEKQHHVS